MKGAAVGLFRATQVLASSGSLPSGGGDATEGDNEIELENHKLEPESVGVVLSAGGLP